VAPVADAGVTFCIWWDRAPRCTVERTAGSHRALDGKEITMPTKVTVPAVRAHKTRLGAEPLVMLTAYDAPGARMVDAAGADLILVGDSVAMVVLGYDDTLQVTVEDIAHHTAAVARTKPRALVVADLPWMSYHVSVEDTVRNAAMLVRAGAECVKLEGGRKRLPMIEALLDAEVPVMGHIGLTPQSVHAMGGFRVQGRETSAALALVDDAKALAHAGCFAVVIEGVPDQVAGMITDAIDVPTIGIGAGPHCDGQVLVFHDVLGIEDRVVPKFVRRYADVKTLSVDALRRFGADVRSGAFPGDAESYHLNAEQSEALGLYGGRGA
jgi:3-methyl-2-oxobutanoate hydroxymethyltransferase